MVKLDASLNAEAGAMVKNELHRLAEQIYKAQQADGETTSPAQRTAPECSAVQPGAAPGHDRPRRRVRVPDLYRSPGLV
jgi:hypothetical protein